MEWIKIERDKDGFATEECLDKMTRALPCVLLSQFNEHGVEHFYDVATLVSIDYWMVEINTNTHYTHYLPLPKLEV